MRKIIPLLFFLCLQNISAFDVAITHKEIEASTKTEFNRSFYWYGDMELTGALQLNNRYTFNSGFLIGWTKYHTNVQAFTGALIEPWIHLPLGFSLAYMYNGLPTYEAHSHTLLPSVSYNARYGGFSAGTSFRFTSFFREKALFESILSLSAHVNFVNNEKLRIGITIANFSNFSAGNMGSYSLTINSAVQIAARWRLFNDLEFMQSGSVGLSSNFYGIAWRGGAKFIW